MQWVKTIISTIVIGVLGYGLSWFIFPKSGSLLIALISCGVGFITSFSNNNSSDIDELIDDLTMIQKGTPTERAMYNQLKRNGKKK